MRRLLLTLLALLLSFQLAFAHGGGLDANGGHP